jgi:acetyl-CoA acyltransferase
MTAEPAFRAEPVYIVEAVRTAIGKRDGKLAGWHPVDLGAELLVGLLARVEVDPQAVEDVVWGCVSQVGEQAFNVGRNTALAAGLPDTTCGTTVDRQCGSSLQAVQFAAQSILAGHQEVVVAGGVESMSRLPLGSSLGATGGMPFGPRMTARYEPDGGLLHQGSAADQLAHHSGFSRPDLDLFAATSQQRAAAATQAGSFVDEIVPVATWRVNQDQPDDEPMVADEGIRPGTTVEVLATLKPAFASDGLHTAGSSSQISDGAAAALLCSEAALVRHGLAPLARIVSVAVAGVSPVTMLSAPGPATNKALQRAGISASELSCVEVNEAFAAVALDWGRQFEMDPDRVNPNGGAIALGHPLGASGARLLATLTHQLVRVGGRYGLAVMCEGGGMANAMVVENLRRT